MTTPILAPLRILLAEDDPLSRHLATMLLTKAGYQADSVETGAEVLEALRQQTYDIILMDVRMPEMDGLEASRRIRRELPVVRWPWIVAVTGSVTEKDRETCLAAGMDDYIRKPLRAKSLMEALDNSQPYTRRAGGVP